MVKGGRELISGHGSLTSPQRAWGALLGGGRKGHLLPGKAGVKQRATGIKNLGRWVGLLQTLASLICVSGLCMFAEELCSPMFVSRGLSWDSRDETKDNSELKNVQCIY